jgi:hypothetical protein
MKMTVIPIHAATEHLCNCRFAPEAEAKVNGCGKEDGLREEVHLLLRGARRQLAAWFQAGCTGSLISSASPVGAAE